MVLPSGHIFEAGQPTALRGESCSSSVLGRAAAASTKAILVPSVALAGVDEGPAI